MANAKQAERLTVEGEIPVFIPKEHKGEETLYVSINGVKAYLKRGETLYVSAPFAALIRNKIEAEQNAERYIEDNAQI